MTRKPYDNTKAEKIKAVLRKTKQGLWLAEISRKTKMPKSTVYVYLNKTDLKKEVIISRKFGTVKSSVIVLYKLKKQKNP